MTQTLTKLGAKYIVFTIACLSASSASAQNTSADAVLQSFSQCRSIAAAEDRVDCFDRSSQALEKAVKSGEVAIADRQEVRSAQRSLFGLSAVRIPFLRNGDSKDKRSSAEGTEKLDTTVTKAYPVANGNVQLQLAESGAVWVTTDPMPFLPRAGSKVTIKRGALGNYFINVEGQRSVRGMRLR